MPQAGTCTIEVPPPVFLDAATEWPDVVAGLRDTHDLARLAKALAS